MNSYNSLWVEKYRPKSLDDIILNNENRRFFHEIDEETPHVLLWGTPGTGKTTLAKIIVNSILKCQYLYINASDENGVDTIRNKVISFSQIKSFDGQKKVVILDEADGLTNEGQRILRNVMEEYSNNTRFILTSNYINKIIEPIQSRCLLFNLKPNLQDSFNRCLMILEQEKVEIDEDLKTKLFKFVEKRHPDLRRTINDLQKFSVSKNLDFDSTDQIQEISITIFKSLLQKQNITEVRKIAIENEMVFNSNYQDLLKSLFDLIYKSKLEDKKKKTILLEIGEHMYRDNFVLDHEINFFCCLLTIEKII